MPKLTQKFVEKRIKHPSHGQVFYRNTILQGFAVRVTSKSKSYIVECRINGINRRITIGPHGALSTSKARSMAHQLLADMKTGKDPKRAAQKKQDN